MITPSKTENIAIAIRKKLITGNQFILLPSIAMIFVSCLIIANVTASKPLSIWWFTIPGGALIFPLEYIFGNILTEVYGFKWARFLIYTAVLCNFLCIIYVVIVGHVPGAGFWHHQKEYDSILGVFPRVVVASSISYLFGEYINSYVISKLKIFTHGKYLWARVVLSTLIGSIIDSLFFIPIAFFGVAHLTQMLKLGFSLTVFKVGYEILALPLTYIIVFFLKRIECVDVFDYNTKYTPFSLDLTYSEKEKNNVICMQDFVKQNPY